MEFDEDVYPNNELSPQEPYYDGYDEDDACAYDINDLGYVNNSSEFDYEDKEVICLLNGVPFLKGDIVD